MAESNPRASGLPSLRWVLLLVLGGALITTHIAIGRFECVDIKRVCAPFGEIVECKVNRDEEKVDVSDIVLSAKDFIKRFPTIERVNGVPKVVHQIYLYHGMMVSREYAEHMKTFKKEMPNWEHVLWTDKDMDEIILKQHPKYADLYRSYYQVMSQADMAKILILHSYGGFYADLDVKMVSSIESELKPTEGVWFPYWKHLESAIIASMPGHPFLDRALEVMQERDPKLRFYNFDYDILATTGPLALEHAYNTFSLKASFVDKKEEYMSPYKGRVVALWPHDRFLFGAHMTQEAVQKLGNHPIAHHYFVHEWLWKTKKAIFRSIGFGLITAYVLVSLLFFLRNQLSKRGQKKLH